MITGKKIALIAVAVFVAILAAFLFIGAMRPESAVNPAKQELPKEAAQTPRGAGDY